MENGHIFLLMKRSIIQDCAKDWAEESVTMNKVYRNGICNIAACDSPNSNSSIFQERNPFSGEPLTTEHKFDNQRIRFFVIPDWIKLCRENSLLYSRGWAIQERVLSSRIMHFSNFPFWECRAAVKSEIQSLRYGDITYQDSPKSERDWIAPEASIDKLTARWQKLLHVYSKSSLTYESDKLVALSGMAKEFSKLLKEPYYAGIWGGKFLVESLLWSIDQTKHPSVAVRPAEYRGLFLVHT
jgi:hypothetical protein